MQVLSRDPGNAADAEVELAAVLRVRVLREGTGGGVGGALHKGVLKMKSFRRRFAKNSSDESALRSAPWLHCGTLLTHRQLRVSGSYAVPGEHSYLQPIRGLSGR